MEKTEFINNIDVDMMFEDTRRKAKLSLLYIITRALEITRRYWEFRSHELLLNNVVFDYDSSIEIRGDRVRLVIEVKLHEESVKDLQKYLIYLRKMKITERLEQKRYYKVNEFRWVVDDRLPNIEQSAEQLAETFDENIPSFEEKMKWKVLNHPVRRQIIFMLYKEPMQFTDLANKLRINDNTLAYHLRQLRDFVMKDEKEGFRGKYILTEKGREFAKEIFGEMKDGVQT